jgi:PAS domain S-box-containing protein
MADGAAAMRGRDAAITPFSLLLLALMLSGLAYFAVLVFSPLLAPYRFPIPYAVPIFDGPFVIVAVSVGYLCFERYRVRQDRGSVVLGSTLAVAAILATAHIVTQPDYPGTPGINPGIAPYFLFLSYLAAFAGIALATGRSDRSLRLSDGRVVVIIGAVVCLGALIVLTVLAVGPLLPSPIRAPGRLGPTAIWVAGLTNGAVAAWGFWRARRRLSTGDDWFAPFLVIAGCIWLIGLLGFLLFPARYAISWYLAGFARPIGVGVIFVGLIREQARLYREIASKNADLAARERVARAHADESDARFRDLVHGLDAIVWEADEAWQFAFVNQRAEAILGHPVARWLADRNFLRTHLHPDDAEQAIGNFQAASQRGTNQDFEYRAIAADGRTVWLRAMIHVVPDQAGSGRSLRGLMIDITQRKQLEDKVRHVQKMEALGRLAGGVAHDFNNLLTVIIGQAQFLRTRAAYHESLAPDIDVIERAAGRGGELTRQLVAFGRKQVLTPKVLDLNTVVFSMAAMLRRVIGEHIELVTRPEGNLWRVKADLGQIEQVIMNLAVNARDAMPHGGQLTIETANVERDTPALGPRAAGRARPHVALTVRDTGTGIDKHTQARIFEPFFTTKERGQGTGLGLSTVDGIVGQSGGWIDVWTEPGLGAAFTIYLPRVADPTAPVDIPAQPAQGPGRDAIVLLVEDDPSVRQMARESLRSCGYTVIEAANGAEALTIVRRRAGRIDLLLTDVLMPTMNGRELVDRLVSIRPDTKILYMSGYTEDVIIDHVGVKLRTAFLPKPFSPESLIRKVRAVLDGARVDGNEPERGARS